MSDDEERYGELAHRLFAATLSYQMGLSYATVEKKYRDTQIGAYWIALAKKVITDGAQRSVTGPR